MDETRSSAKPNALLRYSNSAVTINADLTTHAGNLARVLRQFAATCTEFPTGIDEAMAKRLGDYAVHNITKDNWVRDVGNGFIAADHGDPAAAAAPVYLKASAATNPGQVELKTTQPAPKDDDDDSWIPGPVRDAWHWLTNDAADWFVEQVSKFVDWIGDAFDWAKDAWDWLWKQLGNFLLGFLWGETWFDDVAGADFVAFLGDLVAGLVIYGDVRDVVKYWIVEPIRGEGPWWFNLLMGGVALVGVVPLFGDILKPILKQLIKRLLKTVAKELAEELGEAAAKKLIKELGEDAAKKLTKDLGADTLKKLLADLSPKEIQALYDQLGTDVLKHLAGGFTGKEIQALAASLGPKALKEIGSHLTPAELKEFIKELGEAQVKDLAEKYGGEALKHYGWGFFKSYKGVTSDTWDHLKVPSINKGQVKGCHDDATFQKFLVQDGNGMIVGQKPHPNDPNIIEYEYKLYQRNSDGSLKLDGNGQPIPSVKTNTKTVIKDLSTNPKWGDLANRAVDQSIKNKHLSPSGGKFNETIDGYEVEGYVRQDANGNWIVHTFYIVVP